MESFSPLLQIVYTFFQIYAKIKTNFPNKLYKIYSWKFSEFLSSNN